MSYLSDLLDPKREGKKDFDEAWNSLVCNTSVKDAANYLSEYVSGSFEEDGNSLLY